MRTTHAGDDSQNNDQNARCRGGYQCKAEGRKKNPEKSEEECLFVAKVPDNECSEWFYSNISQEDAENLSAGLNRRPSKIALQEYG